jgi:hypothetical protein
VVGHRPGRLGFWWRTGPASEPLRETVRLHCAQVWSEYAAVLYLGRRGVTYDVPGRRRDGTRRHKRPLRWLAHLVVVAVDALLSGVLLLPVLLPILLVLDVLDGVGTVDATSWEFGQPKLAVSGAADTHAVAFGDHVRRQRHDLWLVWSGTRIAVVAADGQQPARVLWQVDDAAAHDIKPSSGVIDFADGSTMSFVPSDAELDRLRAFDDRP